jgi:UDP-N-acetylglucosamine diphosphorylase/glucosamine-1-phosphate N-acetyltransferase
MHVVIFEGSRWTTFAPVSLARPVFTLLTGTGTVLQKQLRHLQPTRITFWVRPELVEHCQVRIVPKMPCPADVNVPLGNEPAFLMSGRAVPLSRFEFPPHAAVMTDDTGDEADDGLIHSAYLTDSAGLSPQDVWNRSDRWLKLHDLPHMMSQGRMVDSLWELIHWNEESLVEDATLLRRDGGQHPQHAGPYHLINDEDCWVEEGATLCPGVVLDASKGPVIIGKDAYIGANSVLNGPCFVGAHTFVRPLSLIRAGTSIGPFCNVGGELSNTIILGNTNKAHDGYLGDSYLGKWINLGAGTCTSNLKNTYGEISVPMGGGRQLKTGRIKLGVLMGDHTKTAILTRLTAGSYVGFCSMLAGAEPPSRFVPSYTFWGESGPEPYRLDKAMEVTRKVFARRDRQFTEADERLMQYVASEAPKVESAAAGKCG